MRRWEARATAAAEAERQRLGKTRWGKAPNAVDETPADKAQRRFTDPELGSMQTNNKGGASCANAQGSVDAAHPIIVAGDVTAEAHDKQPARPMAQLTVVQLEPAGIKRPQGATGAAQQRPATSDCGDDSETAAAAREQWGCAPSMATGRPRHHGPDAEVMEAPTTATARRVARVQSPEGRALYARRTVSVEPVFGMWRAGAQQAVHVILGQPPRTREA
jgi:hypothetical protein